VSGTSQKEKGKESILKIPYTYVNRKY